MVYTYVLKVVYKSGSIAVVKDMSNPTYKVEGKLATFERTMGSSMTISMDTVRNFEFIPTMHYEKEAIEAEERFVRL